MLSGTNFLMCTPYDSPSPLSISASKPSPVLLQPHPSGHVTCMGIDEPSQHTGSARGLRKKDSLFRVYGTKDPVRMNGMSLLKEWRRGRGTSGENKEGNERWGRKRKRRQWSRTLPVQHIFEINYFSLRMVFQPKKLLSIMKWKGVTNFQGLNFFKSLY